MKIEITFNDNDQVGGGQGVSVTCTPSLEILRNKWMRKETMTPAECMALVCAAAALRSSQDGELADRIKGKIIHV